MCRHDPAYPIERLSYMIADSRPVIVLTQPQVPRKFMRRYEWNWPGMANWRS